MLAPFEHVLNKDRCILPGIHHTRKSLLSAPPIQIISSICNVRILIPTIDAMEKKSQKMLHNTRIGPNTLNLIVKGWYESNNS